MSNWFSYLAGLLTAPVLGALMVIYFRINQWFRSKGWEVRHGVYDQALDSDLGYIPGEWKLSSWGPFHKGSWSHMNSRWIAFGKRHGNRSYRDEKFHWDEWAGITIIKVRRSKKDA